MLLMGRSSTLHDQFLQPVSPFRETLASLAGHFKYLQLRVKRKRVPPDLLHVNIKIRRKIDLVQEKGGRFLKHQRILERLIMSFGNTEDHDLDVFSHFKFCWAYKITDILDKKEIKVLKRKLTEHLRDHVGIEMAGTSRVYLHHRSTAPFYPLGIVTACNIAFNDTDPES